jgi:PIN like domain
MHQRHGQHFQAGTEDSVWLPFVGQQGWIVLTKDKRIRFNQLEKAAVRRYRVREFYFSSGNFTGVEMAEILTAALPGMVKIVKRYSPPFIASISRSGQVSLKQP